MSMMWTSYIRCKPGNSGSSTCGLMLYSLRNCRMDAMHFDSKCGRFVFTLAKIGYYDTPTCFWNHGSATRSSFPAVVYERQCRMNSIFCPVPCWTYKCRKFAPPSSKGLYRIVRFVFLLNPHLATMIDKAFRCTSSNLAFVMDEHVKGYPTLGR